MTDELDLVSKLGKEEEQLQRFMLSCISPDDAKYGGKTAPLKPYLTAEAEWRMCCKIQEVLLQTRVEFGKAKQENLNQIRDALNVIDPLNIAMLEDLLHHDQLAVLAELGRFKFVSEETTALLHPGTTSYDVLDTARSYLFKEAWHKVIRPKIGAAIEKICDLAERSREYMQVGRTHLQNTSPVTFGLTLSRYATRLANRMERCDLYFDDLRGKVSGIVGTGGSIDMVIGDGQSVLFEEAVLEKLGLKPDYSATQIVQKERLADVGNGLTTMMHVLADFANDIRRLYSSAIGEVTTRDNAQRLGGSSADATKNNPINWENIAGTEPLVEGGMRALYFLIQSDHERDLRGSKTSRYQPQAMMAEIYESFTRLDKLMTKLDINEDRMEDNLAPVRKKPTEALVAILRGEGWVHSQYGTGHEFIKQMGIKAVKEQTPFMKLVKEDGQFNDVYERLPHNKKAIIDGELEKYLGSTQYRIAENLGTARAIIRR